MYQDLPTDLVRPAADNLRRRTGDVSDIVASIKENPTLGIIEPLVVAPQEDGTYIIVAGARRHAAAVKAELATVPCIVKPMTEEERVLAMLIENDSRCPLRVTEQAAGYFRLVEAGWRIKDAAKATGRTAKHVASRLALLQLPADIRAKVDDGEITVGDAALLLKLRHHPDVLQEVASSIAEGEDNDVAWAVGQALGRIERQARRTAVLAELAEAGVAAVEHDGFGLPQGLAEIGAHRGLDVDVDAHAGEDCHLVVVTRDGSQRSACADPARHAKKGTSELKATRPTRATSEGELAQRADQKALRAAATTRAEFLRELLGRRLGKAAVIDLVLHAYLRAATQMPAKAACELLGIEAAATADDPYGSSAIEGLVRYAEAGDAHLQRAALALAFAHAEEHMGALWGPMGWADPAVVAHLRFLDAAGYVRSDFEDERLVLAAEGLERRAAEQEAWRRSRARVGDDSEEGTEDVDEGIDEEEADGVPA